MLRLVTFDVNNTLLRVRGSVGDLYRKTALNYGFNQDAETLDTEFRKAYKLYCNKYSNFGVHNSMSTEDWWFNVVSMTFKNAGCGDNQLVQRIASSLYQDFSHASNWELFAEVEQVLHSLKSKGFTLGVVSNFDERLPKILEGLELMKYFSFILCSSEAKIAKPSTKMFQLALKQGGASPEEALHVGDDIMLDYHASKDAGMSAYLVDRYEDYNVDDRGINPDRIISDLNPLINL